MLTVEEIKRLMDEDAASEKKKRAIEGVRYYEGDHDILKKRIFYVTGKDGEERLVEDKLKSNVRIPHPFFTEIVDQEVQYLLSGNEPIIKSDIPELQTELDRRFNYNEDFLAELHELLTGAVVKGFEYAYLYKNKDNETAMQCADSLGVIEVRASDTQKECDYIIHSYVDRIENGTKAIKRIEVWDKTQTWLYCQVDDGEIELDTSEPYNPRPHTIYHKGKAEKAYGDSYGFIPFLRLDNNRKQHSGLKPIKHLIDDYDVISCDFSNMINDTVEALYIVKGFEGDDLDVLMRNLRSKKTVGTDKEGSVEVQTVDIPVEARMKRMETNERNIFRFGMGLDMSSLKDSAATVSVAIKAAYSLLDLKVNKLEMQTKQFLRNVLGVVLDEINQVQGTDYKKADVYFNFTREIIINQQENAQIELTNAQKRQAEINVLLSLEEKLGNEMMMQLICEQLDMDYEEIKDKLPGPEEDPVLMAQAALEAAPVEGGVVE